MQLGWIDFSQTERSKVLDVLGLLTQNGTLDELGIAPIRDGFSNRLFPGTSTIQTRAKYFFEVAYALKQLEKDTQTNPNEVLKRLDNMEEKCAKILYKKNNNEDGLIGKEMVKNGRWVKRTPSSIYWSGLKKYGIFIGGDLSLSEYVRVYCEMKEKKINLKELGNRNDNDKEKECDDKNAGDLFNMQFWKIPTYEDRWMKNFKIQLSKAEGAFLKEQIIANTKGSMLAYILENNITSFVDCTGFKELAEIIDIFPDDIQEIYNLALDFSRYVYALRTVYNVIVSDGENKEANERLEQCIQDFENIANIDIDYIMKKLEITNMMLKRFLDETKKCWYEKDIQQLKQCICNREEYLKDKSRARTAHPGEFDKNSWFGGRELSYRFYNARTIVRDIMESEGKINA